MMSNLSPVEFIRLELNCLEAALNAEDIDFKRLWLKKAAALHDKYNELKEGTS